MKPILLVEAEAFFAGKFIETFEGAGYSVRHVKDAPTAMRLLEMNPDGYSLVCCRPIVCGPYITAWQFMKAACKKPDAQNLPFLILIHPPNESESFEIWKAQKVKWNMFDEGRTATAIMMCPDDILAATAALLSKKETELQP